MAGYNSGNMWDMAGYFSGNMSQVIDIFIVSKTGVGDIFNLRKPPPELPYHGYRISESCRRKWRCTVYQPFMSLTKITPTFPTVNRSDAAPRPSPMRYNQTALGSKRPPDWIR